MTRKLASWRLSLFRDTQPCPNTHAHIHITTTYPIKFAQHDDVIKCKHLPRYWPFVRGIQRSQVNSPHKGQWLGALMFSLICAWINGWVNKREAGDLRRYRAHYDVTVMKICCALFCCNNIDGYFKKYVTPLLTHWGYVCLALTHRYYQFWEDSRYLFIIIPQGFSTGAVAIV